MVAIDESPIDIAGLRSVYKNDASARALLDHLAARKRSRTTTVERLLYHMEREGHPVTRGELIQILRKLQTLECGEFIPGRRGKPSRFDWQVSLVSVGQAAAGETDDIEEAPDAEDEEQDESLIKHTFQLRRDVPIAFELPSDLTSAEAERIATFVKALPFQA